MWHTEETDGIKVLTNCVVIDAFVLTPHRVSELTKLPQGIVRHSEKLQVSLSVCLSVAMLLCLSFFAATVLVNRDTTRLDFPNRVKFVLSKR